MSTTLKIAVQKKGRLSELSLELLKKCHINVSKGTHKLVAPSSNYPIEVLFLRNHDIPKYVANGVADIGIIGEDVLFESQSNLDIAFRLGFAKCRLSLAIPKEANYTDLSYFNNKKIATSYSKILKQFLDKNNIHASIENISGSVEIAPGIGLADSVCDIVSSGSTLRLNGLKEVAEVMKIEAILCANQNLNEEKKRILNQLLFRIEAVQNAKKYKYILLNAPNTSIAHISQILPGAKSPTIIPLALEGWSSLHSLVKENEFWEVVDQLKEAGAEGVLMIPVEKMIF